MSRIRTIKPEFFLNDELAELSPLTRLLFIGLWTLADCKGRMEDRPKRIRAQLHPFDDGDTDAMLQSLHEGRFINRYEVNGKRYLEITTFTKHQRLTGKEADASSEIPAPQQSTVDQGENWGNIGETLGKDFSFTNAQERKGREKEGKGREVIAHAQDTHEDRHSLQVAEATPVEAAAVEASGQGPDDFETFWTTYPKRAGGNPRTTALKAWNARCKDGHKASVIIDGARRYAAYCQATGKLDSEYVKQASTFLNQLSFLDPWNLPTPTPHNGQPRPFLNKQDRIAAQNEAAIAEWLASRRHETHVLEGECHEIH